jgi:signal-transduction protein with cAMP-binding, CBS, and nucleotidyltransferase domain
MRALDAIRKQPVTTSPETSIADVARRMNEEVVGAVVIVDAFDHPVGIVTDRDLVVRGIACAVPVDARIDAVMTSDPIVLDADADLREAFRLFDSHGCRRLPLVREGAVVGMLTADDLLIDLVGDLAELARPITGQVVFGYPERPSTPVPT